MAEVEAQPGAGTDIGGQRTDRQGWIAVTRGRPTDEELAALVGVLFARAGARAEAPPGPVLSRWAASARPGYAQRDRRPTRPSAHAWRASTLPS